jgi:hypothetical protein
MVFECSPVTGYDASFGSGAAEVPIAIVISVKQPAGCGQKV